MLQKERVGKEIQPPIFKQGKEKKTFSYWVKKNWYYHQRLQNLYQFIIPKGARVLQVGCNNGYLLAAVEPSYGVGVDGDHKAIEIAQQTFAHLHFIAGNISEIKITEPFDYIILSSIIMETYDIQDFLQSLHRLCGPHTRLIVDTYSYLWEPVLWLTQKFGLRRPTEFKNWIAQRDLKNFLHLAGFEIVTQGSQTILPVYIPFFSALCNTFLAQLPIISSFNLTQWLIARPQSHAYNPQSVMVSVIIPCKNERGNIESAIQRCPELGAHTQFIFVDGNSSDGTFAEMQRIQEKYADKDISCFVQKGAGKAAAVHQACAQAQGDIIMIQDGDLTAPPEELPKFFYALIRGSGEFINGSRLVYGMDPGEMRFLGLLANHFFSWLFSWILGQPLKDTLCGTKVFWKKDYEAMCAHRSYFGEFDPFGDFDLLFGAAKLNRKIVDMPVHYKKRQYGHTQIQKFKCLWLLLGMSLIGIRKFKFR